MDAGRITHDWDVNEFSTLSTNELTQMGLRAWSLCGLQVTQPALPVNKSCDALPFDIQADSLRVGYTRRQEVLKGLSFLATSGHVIAVVGRNGQGKSTLARVIAGLMRETYGGISIDARPLNVRDRIGNIYLVLQESAYQLFASSVRKEFTIGMKPERNATTECIDDLLLRFGLAEKQERHPASLSGGEKQRLALAVGVHAGAKLLVLDEPTSGLDLTNMQRCALEIRRLADSGCCIFVITHDAELVATACDQVIEIANGKVRNMYALTPFSLPRALCALAPDFIVDTQRAGP
jgi:energy-coupling factor transport system ATP-binding protein